VAVHSSAQIAEENRTSSHWLTDGPYGVLVVSAAVLGGGLPRVL